MAIISDVGNGENTLFWTDRWLHGQCIKDLTPQLFAMIPQRKKLRTVQQALTNRTWISDIQGALTVGVIVEYFQLWDLLYDFELQPEVVDSHTWKLSNSAQYSAKSAYDSLFMGKILFRGKEFGKLGR
jgi:hypothetical protein